MKKTSRLAVIGSGPSAVYLLLHLLNHIDEFLPALSDIYIFEKNSVLGTGMPYSRATTDKYNMCNISSAEIPQLHESLVDWLRSLSDRELAYQGIERENIDADETYCRTTLGDYFRTQHQATVSALRGKGVSVHERPGCRVTDVVDLRPEGIVEIHLATGNIIGVDRAVIATGHAFHDPDDVAAGYFASPWPIHKLIPQESEFYNFEIGTLGASLSAFDVVASLSNRHGRFTPNGDGLVYEPYPGAEDFRIALHSSQGWLPHLQYEQEEPFREIYRHVDRDALLALRDEAGFLPLDSYFDRVCRPALATAFAKDRREDVVQCLRRDDFSLEDFVQKMSDEHASDDAFALMRSELPAARRALRKGLPMHWKEVLDDLIFTLNFHFDLLCAEDYMRYRQVITPFLMNVIAAMPLASAQTLLALHDAGKLELVSGRVSIKDKRDGVTQIEVDSDGETKLRTYRLFIDCSGQGSLDVDEYPFPSLTREGAVSEAMAAFRDHGAANRVDESQLENIVQHNGSPAMRLGGIAIDGYYRVIGRDGQPNDRIYDIAFPHATGIRPYSYGLQACDATAAIVVQAWCEQGAEAEQPSSDVEAVTRVYEGLAEEDKA